MYGTIYKLFNVKLAYLAAVFIFEVGSLISAVAPSSVAFIVGRAIAGVCLFSTRLDSNRELTVSSDWMCWSLFRFHRHLVPHQFVLPTTVNWQIILTHLQCLLRSDLLLSASSVACGVLPVLLVLSSAVPSPSTPPGAGAFTSICPSVVSP